MMKPLLVLTALFALALAGCQKDTGYPAGTVMGKKVAWMGIDYSLTRLSPASAFPPPEEIFPVMPHAWNRLYIRERYHALPTRLDAYLVDASQAVYAPNDATSGAQLIETADKIGETHITPEIIAEKVKSYPLDEDADVGLVFIVDRMVKNKRNRVNDAAIYAVYFDAQTREVLSAERGIYSAGGMGFRNYWFNPIKWLDRSLNPGYGG